MKSQTFFSLLILMVASVGVYGAFQTDLFVQYGSIDVTNTSVSMSETTVTSPVAQFTVPSANKVDMSVNISNGDNVRMCCGDSLHILSYVSVPWPILTVIVTTAIFPVINRTLLGWTFGLIAIMTVMVLLYPSSPRDWTPKTKLEHAMTETEETK